MLIEIKQVRRLPDGKPGTDVDLTTKGGPANVLQFRPLDPAKPDQDHVCDVNDQDDIAQLLAVKEGFRIHASQLKPGAPAKKASDDSDAGGNDEAGEQVDKAALIAAVEKATGKKPHPSTSVKKLKELLAGTTPAS